MSLIIKELKLPKHCWQCWLKDEDDNCTAVYANPLYSVMEVYGEERRPEWCPLIALPTADELAEDMRTVAKDKDKEISHRAMDDIMCGILCEIGYEEAVAIFDNTPKWYA